MKIKFLYLIAALVLFANCSESPSDPTPFTEEISTESSSDMDSSTSISSSSVFESSSSNQVSSSSILDSSTEGPSVSSSSVTPSSSSSIFQRSSSSKRHNDLVEPDAPLSSSGSGVATIPLRSFIDSNETRTVNLRVLYPAEEGKLDTGFFSLNQCFLYEDGSFKCKQGQCMENVGGTISVPYGGITIQVDYHDNDSSAYGRYFHESTETTLLFDVNLGDSAITSYIPYSNIPEFDKANVKSHLETLSTNGCEVLFRYEGYYRLYAEGLPEGIILYHDGSGLNPTVRYSPFASANSEDFEKITEHYTSLSNPETTDSIINEIPSIQSLVDYCEQEHGSHCNNGLFDVFTEKKSQITLTIEKILSSILFPRTNTVAGSLRIPITRKIWQDTVMVGNCPTSPKGIPAASSTFQQKFLQAPSIGLSSTRTNTDVAAQCKSRANSSNFLRKNACF